MQAYSNPARTDDPHALPDVEYWYMNQPRMDKLSAVTERALSDDEKWMLKAGAGWYWWTCYPGCLPEGDGYPNGPFATEAECIADFTDETLED